METTTNRIEAMYPIASTFNVPLPPEAKIDGLAPGLAGVPAMDSNYVFEEERLREFTAFWIGRFKALMIEGDPSAGKTSLVEQWHARLNVPLHVVSCAPTTESYKLIGQLLPTPEGTLRWQDGPVVMACREGTSCLLDEYNTMDPGEATALNLALEGKSFMIPETGERITPHPRTRFFATQNPVDSKLMVAGRNVQDVANDDRFCYMQVDYLQPALENSIVVRSMTSAGMPAAAVKDIATICVDVANSVRRAFRDGSNTIDKPLSTRAVMRWARLAFMYTAGMRKSGKRISGIHYALGRAVRMESTMLTAVYEMITLKAGYDENMNS